MYLQIIVRFSSRINMQRCSTKYAYKKYDNFQMRLNLIWPRTPKNFPFYHPSIRFKWKKYFIPSWPVIYHCMELICLLYFYQFIVTPTIDFCYLNRDVFVDAFYPDIEEGDEPITRISDITDYFEQIVDSLDALIDDSFMDIYISNISYPNIDSNTHFSTETPIWCEIAYLNGSTFYVPFDLDELDFDNQFFKHLDHINVYIDFYIFSNSPEVAGCSRWKFQSSIYSKVGSSQFSIIPEIQRVQCDKSLISHQYSTPIVNHSKIQHKKFNILPETSQKVGIDSKSEVHLNIIREFQDKIQQKAELNKKKKLTPTFARSIKAIKERRKHHRHHKRLSLSRQAKFHSIHQSNTNSIKSKKFTKFTKNFFHDSKRQNKKLIPKQNKLIYQNSLKIYRATYQFSVILIFISFIHFICIFVRFHQSTRVHFDWISTQNDYKRLNVIHQIHFTIGYWSIIDLISTILVFISSFLLFMDTFKLTQFPSQSVIEFISVSMFVTIIRFSQWLGGYLPFYQLIVILREAFMKLVYIIISILPIVTGLSLFGIFVFGYVENSYETFRYLVQRMITSGMGDSIDDFFIITDDGTEVTVYLGFLYVGVITALGMWIVFTSCIATVSYVHQNYIVARDSYWRNSSDESSDSQEMETSKNEMIVT